MQARSQRTRQKLVHAGAEMFNRNGYANATLGQIAGAAGMTKGALYFHFSSKDGLADAVQEHGRAMLQGFVREHWEAGVPPVQMLIDMTHWLARTLHDDPVIRASFRITNECAGRQPPVTDFHQDWITEVLRLLGQAREAGELRARATGSGPATLLAATVCGIGVLAGTGMPYQQLSDRVAALWEPLLSALVPPDDVANYRTRPPVPAARFSTGGEYLCSDAPSNTFLAG
ncbi:ScbR family autoregulator-binding transcription factor [Streptomyces sp. NPDC057900]|uniref:ScbR family autoregulator-binding transcription factor n=1 Tax=Streptomyces sp. NPDC057900 TaxID=3346274 RepID=UPI0036E2FDB4